MVNLSHSQTAALVGMSRLSVSDSTLEGSLERVANLVNDSIPRSDMVGATLLSEKGRPTMGYSDETASRLDRAQYRWSSGPAVDAFCYGEVRRTEAMESDARWPALAVAAKAAGIASSLSLPLLSHDESIGVLNCYSRTVFLVEDEQLGAEYADVASVVLINAQAYWGARELSERLTIAAEYRPIIEQAKGILIAAQRCGPDQAFEILVEASQRENRKLRDIARRIVRSTIAGSAAPSGAGGGRTLASPQR